MEEKIKASYPLDDAALVYMAAKSQKHVNVFRISFTLNEEVREELLQQVLDNICPRYPTMAAGIQKGRFWYRVVPVSKGISVERENGLLQGMSDEQIHECAMRVMYEGRRVSVEMLHALTDGYGGMQFVKSLLGEYLRLAHGIDPYETEEVIDPRSPVYAHELEDSYSANAGGKLARPVHSPSYQISSNYPMEKDVSYGHIILDAGELLETARQYNTSVTSLLTTIMASSLMELQKRHRLRVKPVSIMVPADLRRLFNSRSLRNFTLFATAQMLPGMEKLPLKLRLDSIQEQLSAQFTATVMGAMINSSAALRRNLIFAWSPLFIKCLLLRFFSKFFGTANTSITMSNLGVLSLPEAMGEYIQRIDCYLMPRLLGLYNCCVFSFNGKLHINFSRLCQRPELEYVFAKKLRELGHKPVIELQNEAKDFDALKEELCPV